MSVFIDGRLVDGPDPRVMGGWSGAGDVDDLEELDRRDAARDAAEDERETRKP